MLSPMPPTACTDIPLIDPAAIPPVDYTPFYAFADFLWSGVYYLYLAVFGG